jgi:hypothetical protein
MQKEPQNKKKKLQMKHDKRTKEHYLRTPTHHQGQNKKYELKKKTEYNLNDNKKLQKTWTLKKTFENKLFGTM